MDTARCKCRCKFVLKLKDSASSIGDSLGTIVMEIRDDIIGSRRRSSAVESRRSIKIGHELL